MSAYEQYDVVIIGGGFFGLSIALYLREHLGIEKIIVLEKERDLMQRASYNNQARVHNGYHYPRSLLTALRSRVNFPRFIDEYDYAIKKDFEKYYAVATNFSKVSATQFKLFIDRIGADIAPAPSEVKSLFSKQYIADVYSVTEYAFDSKKLKDGLLKRVLAAGIEIRTTVRVDSVQQDGSLIAVRCEDGSVLHATKVFNCTYSTINLVNARSGLPIIPLKHELTEMALIEMPEALRNISVTVMCGPFFSFMPFPDRGLYTLSHVRYTPHSEWKDTEGNVRDGHDYLDHEIERVSHYPQMINDVIRYIPAMKDAKYKGSLWEVKTVLPQSEGDDSRPILFREMDELSGYICVMGGKLDNIYDVYAELDNLYVGK